MKLIPQFVYDVAKKLEESGREAHLVGGSLRDILMNIEPHDYDIATNALPDEVVKIFPRSVPTGAKFGTIIVIVIDDSGETHEVEVTTYRSEKDYVGGRWPSHVEFSTNIIDDLKRRDFTVNAMALNLCHQANDTKDWHIDLLDPFNGKEDLEKKILKAVGNPVERFREDGLRSMRACRLASVLEFQIEESTFNGIKETLEVAAIISMNRVREELIKLIEDSPKPSVGIELMRESGLLKLYIPELLEGYGLEQNRYHVHDVYQHLLRTVDIAPKEVRFAALFHDIAKPRTKEGEHFYGHDKLGAEMSIEILTRLKFPNKFIQDVSNLIRWHMFYLPEENHHQGVGKDSHPHQFEKDQRDHSFKRGWSDSAIRRMIRRVGGEDNIDNLIKLRIADALANPKSSFNPEEIQVLAQRVAEIREQDSLLSVRDLKISGHDLRELGVPEGPLMKEVLHYLLEQVTEDIELNEKQQLENLVKEYLDKSSLRDS